MKKSRPNEERFHYELRTLSHKVKGMAYMLEGVGHIDSMPLDVDLVYLGISSLLNDIGERLLEISVKL
ncbi:MAG TPA: hypothetical protein VN132_15990, partial [Bdellovibrio sp.]|nr:hypothetical protein [Bdellovibrio sp.]